MKNLVIIFLFFLVIDETKAQDLKFDVHTTHLRSLNKETINSAKEISDICSGYATRWIKDIESVEVLNIIDGKSIKALGNSTQFTEEQKNILVNAEIGSELVLNLNYLYENPATNKINLNTMHYTLSVNPEIEAEYIGGYADMYQYLREKAINKIKTKELPLTRIRFEISELGKVSNIKVFNSSGNIKVDKILVSALQKMPNWKAAIGLQGKKVKQEFELSIGKPGMEGC